MRSEDVQLGMFVQVRRGFREADLRDRIGIVRQRFGNHPYTPFEVQFGVSSSRSCCGLVSLKNGELKK